MTIVTAIAHFTAPPSRRTPIREPRSGRVISAGQVLLPIVLLMGGLGGCSTTPADYPDNPYATAYPAAPQGSIKEPASAPPAVPPDVDARYAHDPVKHALYAQYRDWRGVPYRWGGNNRRGIDCSALVQRTFADHLNQTLPRTTQDQINIGRAVARRQLRAGDLVFFRTGRSNRHVGIYIESSRFLHASTRVGVTISSLDNRYWSRRYLTARRP